MTSRSLYRQNSLSLVITILLALAGRSFSQQCVPSTTVTPEDMLGPFYVENSEMSNRIAPDDLLTNPTLRFFVYGKVLNSSTCVGIPNIVVEAWYAGPPDSDGDYYQTNEYRGQVTTNSLGEYNFTQTFPELYPTRPILHNHFRLSTLSGEELLVTQMYFYGSGNGYVTDRTTRTLQAVDPIVAADGARSAEFNMLIDYAGTATSGADEGFFQRILALIRDFFNLFS